MCWGTGGSNHFSDSKLDPWCPQIQNVYSSIFSQLFFRDGFTKLVGNFSNCLRKFTISCNEFTKIVINFWNWLTAFTGFFFRDRYRKCTIFLWPTNTIRDFFQQSFDEIWGWFFATKDEIYDFFHYRLTKILNFSMKFMIWFCDHSRKFGINFWNWLTKFVEPFSRSVC